MVHAFQGNKVRMGKKLQKWQKQGPYPLAVALLGIDQLPPLWTHPTGSEFVRGSKSLLNPMLQSSVNSLKRKCSYFSACGHRLKCLIMAVAKHRGPKNVRPHKCSVDNLPVYSSPLTSYASYWSQCKRSYSLIQVTRSLPPRKSSPVMQTQNTQTGKRSSSRVPRGNSIPLTQDTWMLSVLDWEERN